MAGANEEVHHKTSVQNQMESTPRSSSRTQHDGGHHDEDDNDNDDEVSVRRNLRSKYLRLKNLLSAEDEDLSTPDSKKFRTIFDQVESLHGQVRKPREQIADAEALLDITSSFVKSVKSQRHEGATPSDLVSYFIRDFRQQDRALSSSAGAARNLIRWKDIGDYASHIFRKCAGCSTMLGPMDAELKTRKSYVRKNHTKSNEMARPEELNNAAEERTDTDKNMMTMFGVLKKLRKVQLENLVLNRISFAQTVENVFALSFLVKDGRAQITANENGHFVYPRNAPDAKAVESGKVSHGHFVFRFDFQDWKVMLDLVPKGEELMPHRVQISEVQANRSAHSSLVQESIPIESRNQVSIEPETSAMTTPIRKRSRNQGLLLQGQTIVGDSCDGVRKVKPRPL